MWIWAEVWELWPLLHCSCVSFVFFVPFVSQGQCNRCLFHNSRRLCTPHHSSNKAHSCHLQAIISQLPHCPLLTSSKLFQCPSVITSSSSGNLFQCPLAIRSRSVAAIVQHRLLIVTRHSRISANLSRLSTRLSLRRLKVSKNSGLVKICFD